MLDVFNTDAFSMVSLTDTINKLKFVPSRIAQMGLFTEGGVTTTTIAVEEREGILRLVPPTPRGGPGTTLDKSKRTIRNITIPKFEINDAIMAEEVQGIRAFGQEDVVETVMGKVTERLGEHGDSLLSTQEYSRIGAIKGVVTYDDGTTLDLFDTFNVTQQAVVDFDLDNASPTDGVLRETCATVIRTIANELGGTPVRGLHAFCGDAFFDDLIKHTEIRASYLQQEEASVLRDPYISGDGSSYGIFRFGGITWENYRGSVDGTDFIDTDTCHIFPVGVGGLFVTRYAPADYVETVNTMGRRFVTKQYMMQNEKGVHMDVQMNALDICTRPSVLVQGSRT